MATAASLGYGGYPAGSPRADYTTTTSPACSNLQPGASCTGTVTFTFTPSAIGNRDTSIGTSWTTGSLLVLTNPGPNLTVTGTGLTGFAPPPTALRARPQAGAAGGGYVLMGAHNVEANRVRFEYALRVNTDGTIRGKRLTLRFRTGSVSYVVRSTVIDRHGLFMAGDTVTFSGGAAVSTISSGVETLLAGAGYRVSVEAVDVANPNGAGRTDGLPLASGNVGITHR